MSSITRLGDGGFIWIALVLFLLFLKKYRLLAKILITSMIINAICVNLMIKPIVQRARPFNVVEFIEIIIRKPLDYSFPSGHTSISFAFVSVVWIFSKSKFLKISTTILAILISFSRLYLYVHYPTDVLFGMIIGIICGISAKYIYQKRKNGKYFNEKIE